MAQKEVWSGSAWNTPVGIPIVVRAVEHAYREGHLVREYTNTTPCWTLDYFFTPVRVQTDREPGWHHRPPFVGHLYPGIFRYREDSRPCRVLPHHAWVRFDIEVNTELLRMLSPTSGYAKFLDPERILGERIVEIAGFAAAHREKAYWSVATMTLDLISQLKNATRVADGIYELHSSQIGQIHDPVIDRAIGFLSEHLTEPIQVEDVARHLKISPSTLAHRFTRVRGEGIKETLRHLRLLRAKPLLLSGRKLDDIAEETGFCDARHFAKAFRKTEGVSPSAFLHRLSARKPANSLLQHSFTKEST